MEWLLDHILKVDDGALDSIAKSSQPDATARGSRPGASLAVRLNDVVIHDARKWFGLGADIRLDAFVVTGPQRQATARYHPATFRFPNVRSGDRLSIEPPGLLVYYGVPAHFVDVFLLVSRDRKDSADLGALLGKQVNSKEWQDATTVLAGFVLTEPQAILVQRFHGTTPITPAG